MDGTGQLSSYKVKCEKCLTRINNSGNTMHLHGQLLASLISPHQSISLPLAFEPIENNGEQTEYQKNDCELNAAKRLLKAMKTAYPKRPFCITGDNLFAVLPFVQQIQSNGWSFIITAKPERNKELFSWYDYLDEKKKELRFSDKEGHQHHFEWTNQLPLRQEVTGKNHFFVNLLEYTELSKDGQVIYYNTWVTDIHLHEGNIKYIAKGGRARFNVSASTMPYS